MGRKRNNFYMRSIFILALCIFGLLQYHNFNYCKYILILFCLTTKQLFFFKFVFV